MTRRSLTEECRERGFCLEWRGGGRDVERQRNRPVAEAEWRTRSTDRNDPARSAEAAVWENPWKGCCE
ncbi:MAG: hypothetical protein PHP76_04755 [Bacteroidales bacterium]|nr:hypothetical protein [Bacteroidales bacterium]